jgi:hypothetical protein
MYGLLENNKSIALLIVGFFVFGLGCGEPMGTENQDAPEGQAAIQGQLAVEGNVDFDATVVTAYEVTGESEATLISREEAKVESDGSFEVFIDLELYGGGDVYVEAHDEESTHGSVLLEARLESGQAVQCAPITAETTFEVETYLEARSSGEWNEDCSTADHRAWISSQAAAAAESSSDFQAEVEAYARASVSAMRASAEYLMEAKGKSRAELESAMEARAEARAQADAELHGGADVEATMEANFEAAAESRNEIEMSAEDQAREMQAAVEAFLIASAEMSAEVRDKAEERAHQKRSIFVEAAVEAKLEALELSSDARDELLNASSTLRSEIREAASTSARVDAWVGFAAELEAVLVSEFEVFSEVLDLSAALDAYAQARAEIDVHAGAEVVTDQCVDALIQLWADAESEALAAADGLIDDKAAKIIVALMIHAELGAQ